MAQTTTLPHLSGQTLPAALGGRLAARAAALRAAWVRYRAYRRTLEELRRLSLRELEDLGMCGMDLRVIARTAVADRLYR